jgi:hypothetical protein
MIPPDHDAQLRRISLRLGLRNGLLIGLALALGAWAPSAIALSLTRTYQLYPALFLGFLSLLLLGGLGGWLAAWWGRAFGGGLVWFLLLLPLPLVFGVGLIADNLVNSPWRIAPKLVHEAIRTGRTYTGDLFELSLERGINYNAIAGVRDQMSAHYALAIGEAQLGAANTVVVVAHFDNDAWINCRVTADQLFHCYDASPPYMRGLPALLTAGETPQDCRECTVKISNEQRDWFLAQSEKWVDPPSITRLAQWGSHVLMRAQSPTGDAAIECLFEGISPVQLVRCQ